jgi:hypothetical protein
MLLYFFFPPCCLCKHRLPRNKCFRSNRWRWLHLGLSLVYTVTNIAYIVADILISDARADQVLLMAVMVVIGVLINRESWLCCQAL